MLNPESGADGGERIVKAQQIMSTVIPALDKTNVLGIFGFGSFWLPRPKKNPRDIDIAVYVKNGAIFLDGDREKIANPLAAHFNLPTQFHVLTPYTPMVKEQLLQYQIFLKEYLPLYGQAPRWL